MAQAERTTITKEVVTVQEQDVIQLTLSLPEARTLRQLMTLIGGSREDSLRAHTDAIGTALMKAGVPWLSSGSELCEFDNKKIVYLPYTRQVME